MASPAEIREDEDEGRQAHGLKNETSNHDVDACAREAALAIVGCVRDCAADGLEEEGEEVRGHEGYCDGARCQAGVVLAVEDDEAGCTEIDCR